MSEYCLAVRVSTLPKVVAPFPVLGLFAVEGTLDGIIL